MPNSKNSHRALCLFACLLCIVALILHIVAYSTSNWLVSNGDSPFQRMGFHEACFDNCYFPYCPGDPDIIFNGCYVWTFNDLIYSNDQFREITDWLFPPWFTMCKNLFSTNIALIFASCLFLIVCTCWAFVRSHTPTSSKKKDVSSIVLGFVTLMILIAATLVNVSGIAIFSSVAPHRQYMPMAYKNHFGYSFWIEFFVCIVLGVCSFLIYLSTISKIIHFTGTRETYYSEDMIGGRT